MEDGVAYDSRDVLIATEMLEAVKDKESGMRLDHLMGFFGRHGYEVIRGGEAILFNERFRGFLGPLGEYRSVLATGRFLKRFAIDVEDDDNNDMFKDGVISLPGKEDPLLRDIVAFVGRIYAEKAILAPD
jgi:hypothetical protein